LLCTVTVPDCLKIAAVKPLYKKGDKTNITNYRSVSLLTVFCKVLKKDMHSRLTFRHRASSMYWPATSWVHYTTNSNTQSSAPEDG